MSVYDTQSENTREEALQAAADAVKDGRLVVLPTDTVYGIGADAFAPDAVRALLEAKGRGRDVPPPVLVGDAAVLFALATDVPEYVERLTEAFWPGPLTIILPAQPSLAWDLGDTRGTVALRMPEDRTALDLLRRTGPLAVSSANRHGKSAALTVLDAATQLGDAVDVYLDGGTARIGTSSTIIDATVEPPEILRDGALSREEIIAAVGDVFAAPEPDVPEDQDDDETAAEHEVGESTPHAGDHVPEVAHPSAGTVEPVPVEPVPETVPESGLDLPRESELAADRGTEPSAASPEPGGVSPAAPEGRAG